ncbi:MAG: FkbM family methyltransferase [Verrucomicrobiota bacterium]|nr:FkbM family methyltransferase [Verrucomicrobiota bacterium]
MVIKDFKEKFKVGEVSKADFISEMHNFHKVLFDFSKNLNQTEIAKIEIYNGKVIYTSAATKYHKGGAQFICDMNDKRTAPVEAFNFDLYEQADSEIIYKLIKDGSTVFDIGANIGWYSIHLAKNLQKCKVYAFEPLPDTFKQLQENAHLNKCDNILLNNFALTNKKQVLTFFYSPSNTVASSSRNIMENAEAIKVECEASTIDDFIADNKITNLDFVKCDVEGAEYFVFKGGIKTFSEQKPIIFTEMLRKWAVKFDYHPNDIIKLFTDIAYKCYVVAGDKLKEIKEVTESTTETNYIFLHPAKHQQQITKFVL